MFYVNTQILPLTNVSADNTDKIILLLSCNTIFTQATNKTVQKNACKTNYDNICKARNKSSKKQKASAISESESSEQQLSAKLRSISTHKKRVLVSCVLERVPRLEGKQLRVNGDRNNFCIFS